MNNLAQGIDHTLKKSINHTSGWWVGHKYSGGARNLFLGGPFIKKICV